MAKVVDKAEAKLQEAKPAAKSVWQNIKPFVNGGASGMLATCVIQPIDMVKVRLQLGAQGSPVRSLCARRSHLPKSGVAQAEGASAKVSCRVFLPQHVAEHAGLYALVQWRLAWRQSEACYQDLRALCLPDRGDKGDHCQGGLWRPVSRPVGGAVAAGHIHNRASGYLQQPVYLPEEGQRWQGARRLHPLAAKFQAGAVNKGEQVARCSAPPKLSLAVVLLGYSPVLPAQPPPHWKKAEACCPVWRCMARLQLARLLGFSRILRWVPDPHACVRSGCRSGKRRRRG